MTEYPWPDWGSDKDYGTRVVAAWPDTVRNLPLGAPVTGEVVGRRPFGVFLSIAHHPEAIGLAEITAMPRCMELPRVGEHVTGLVLWHADHNHQVKIKLTEWDEHADLLLPLADMIGQTVSGQVTTVAPIGAFVRVADCVEGLIRPEELPEATAAEGQEFMVAILGVDLERHRILLAAARGR
ncbi:S1 RNA-binding domain-containing protein [Streptomyces sp. NPDC058086]|uniref:S1 RNA-binding domain-containing protein n=1 Tax=Streptomyces sp. NPDC058086 TaxID=3346334 RepID=UPI0036E8B8A1